MNIRAPIDSQRIILAALLLLVTPAGAAQRRLTAASRARYEADLSRWRKLLDEYHQGKRDYKDGGAILYRVLADYTLLGSSGTADAVGLKKEWDSLLDKHPDLAKQPPLHIHEQTQARASEKERRKQVAAEEASFTPADSQIRGVYGNDRKAVFVYQYRLEFYELPPDLSFKPEPPPNSFFATLYDGDRPLRDVFSGKIPVARLNLKSLKRISFAHRISVSLSNVAQDMERLKYFWACDDLTLGYTASDDQEYEVTRRHPRRAFPWTNSKADVKEFCGVLSLDGAIVFRLPITQAIPAPLVVVAATNPEGTSALIKVGKQVLMTDEDGAQTIPKAGSFSQFIVWTYPDKLQKFDSDSPALRRAVDSAGLKWK